LRGARPRRVPARRRPLQVTRALLVTSYDCHPSVGCPDRPALRLGHALRTLFVLASDSMMICRPFRCQMIDPCRQYVVVFTFCPLYLNDFVKWIRSDDGLLLSVPVRKLLQLTIFFFFSCLSHTCGGTKIDSPILGKQLDLAVSGRLAH
jgi:hypothetical protein